MSGEPGPPLKKHLASVRLPQGPFSQVLEVCHGGADEEAAEARAQAPPHAIRKAPPRPPPGRARPAPTADSGKAAARQLARPPGCSWSRSKSCAAAGAGVGRKRFQHLRRAGFQLLLGPGTSGVDVTFLFSDSTLGQADRARREHCASDNPEITHDEHPARWCRPSAFCAAVRRGAGSSRTLHTVPFSSCTRAHSCRLVIVAAA